MTQQATRILATRHGQTAWNATLRIQGQLDIGLDDVGRWQAQRLAQACADEGFDAVYSSDLARARDTARALASVSGVAVRTDAGLRERGFGVFEGLTYAEVESRFPDQARRWRQRDASFGPAGGEVLQAFYQRVIAAVAALAARHRGQHIAVVAHGGVLDALYRAAARVALDAPRSWQLGNAGINRLLASDEGFVLVGWGDTTHLDQPAQSQAGAQA